MSISDQECTWWCCISSWIKGEISSNHSLDISQSWCPSKSGDYFVETFVWNSLTDPTPLSAPRRTSFFVE